MNLKNQKVVLGLAVLVAALFVVGGFLIAGRSSEPERTSKLDDVVTRDESTDYDALYQEVVNVFSIDEEQLGNFVFFGTDKVIYQDGEDISQVYNDGSGWKLAYKGSQAPSCEEVADVPEGYKVACGADPETGIVSEQGDWDTADPGYYNYLLEAEDDGSGFRVEEEEN